MACRMSCLVCCFLLSISPAFARGGDRRHGGRDGKDNCENSSAFVCEDGSEANMSAEPPCFSGRPKCSNRTYSGQDVGHRNGSGARRQGRDTWNCSDGSSPTCPDGGAPNFSNEIPCSAGRPSCPNQSSPHENGARGRRRGRAEGENCNCTDGSTPLCPDGSKANMSAEQPCISGKPFCFNRTHSGQNYGRRNGRDGRRDDRNGERGRFSGDAERGGARTEENSEFTEQSNAIAHQSLNEAPENGESDMLPLLVGVGVGAVALLVGVCVTIRARRWHMNSRRTELHVGKHAISEVKGSPFTSEPTIKASDIVLGQPVIASQVATAKCIDDAV